MWWYVSTSCLTRDRMPITNLIWSEALAKSIPLVCNPVVISLVYANIFELSLAWIWLFNSCLLVVCLFFWETTFQDKRMMTSHNYIIPLLHMISRVCGVCLWVCLCVSVCSFVYSIGNNWLKLTTSLDQHMYEYRVLFDGTAQYYMPNLFSLQPSVYEPSTFALRTKQKQDSVWYLAYWNVCSLLDAEGPFNRDS